VNRFANPLLVREARSRMRGKRVFILIAIVLTILCLALFLAYRKYETAFNKTRQALGPRVLSAVAGTQYVLILLVTPAFACGAISTEKERRSLDLLMSTALTSRQIVLGKFYGSLSYVFLLVLTGLPVMAFCLVFGGISTLQVFLVICAVLGAAVFAGATGLYWSLRAGHTAKASASAYATVFGAMIVLPMIVYALAGQSQLIDIAMAPACPIHIVLFDEWWRGGANAGNLLYVLTAAALPAILFAMSLAMLHSVMRDLRDAALAEGAGRELDKPEEECPAGVFV